MHALLTLLAAFILVFSGTAHSQDQQLAKARAFYRGKTITMILGSNPGGGVDFTGRILAPILGKNTGARVIIQNRPEGGGRAAMNYLQNRVKPDGLTVGSHYGITQVLGQFRGATGVQYDLTKFEWIGVVGPLETTFMAYKSKYSSLDDVRRATRPLRWGLSAVGGNNHLQGITISRALNLNVRFVTGYRGSASVRQALISGELDVTSFTPNSYVSSFKQGLVAPLMHSSRERHPAIPEVPTIFEVIKELPSPFDIWFNLTAAGFFVAAPPGTPQDRVQFLRQAFKQTMDDPEFLKAARKRNLVLGYLTPEKVLKILKDFLAQPAESREQLKALLKK